MKLRYTLPLGQVCLALFRLERSYAWERAMMRIQDMPGPSPAFEILMSINAPIQLVRLLWYRSVPDLWDNIILVVSIGLLWFYVALNIESWRKHRNVYNFAWRPLAIISDLFFISIAVFFVTSLWHAILHSYFPFDRWRLVCTGIYLIWCVTLVLFFGRDLWICLVTLKAKRP